MTKRASLPGASELFRPTDAAPALEETPEPVAIEERSERPGWPTSSGRVKHDHKITVYFSEQELLALEDANLELRRQHSIRVDRGRLVRAAVALALRDMYQDGADSALVQELRG
ncbi:hypothetical protein [uncultured Tessaracoccus sp.]|uniref:hypothetical protein n=1 Tax=uncultured Tessaracoccus sp. TaxID=905023 RepID=UPI00262C79A1|nr:hypothetical protein [uncultured Tessaracoccus sp.]